MAGSEHTSKQFDAELEAVRARVLQMGGLVESQIRLAVESLITRRCGVDEPRDRGRSSRECDGSGDRRKLQPHPRAPPAGRGRLAHGDDRDQDHHRPGAHRRRGGKDRAHGQAAVAERTPASCRATTKSSMLPIWRWTCCANRWMRLPASIWPPPRKWCARTSWWMRNSAPSCVTSSPS